MYLRGNVIRCANQFIFLLLNQLLIHVFFPLVRKAEVDDFNFKGGLGVHEKILWFEVPVTDLL